MPKGRTNWVIRRAEMANAFATEEDVEKVWSLTALAKQLGVQHYDVFYLKHSDMLNGQYVLYGRVYVHIRAIPIIESAVAALLQKAVEKCVTRLCTVNLKDIHDAICDNLVRTPQYLGIIREAISRVVNVVHRNKRKTIVIDRTTLRQGNPQDVKRLRKMFCQ